MRFRVLYALFVFVFWMGCSAEPGGTQQDVTTAGGCTVVENEDGSVAIKCADGSEVTLGKDEKCSAVDNEDGTVTISCEDGTEYTLPTLDALNLDAKESPKDPKMH